ncbi:MAG TPA: hypothetical protein VGC39_06700 [Candidatus Methylacidiphilales bacterium]
METATMINGQPFLSRSKGSAIAGVLQLRDHIKAMLIAHFHKINVDALVIGSQDYAAETWVRAVCWMPADQTGKVRLRTSAQFNLRACEYCRFPAEIDLELQKGASKKKISNIVAVTEVNVETVIQFLVEPDGEIFRSDFSRCRSVVIKGWAFLAFWLPRNKVKDLKRTWEVTLRKYWIQYVVLGVGLIGSLYAIPLGVIFLGYALFLRFRHPQLYTSAAGKPPEEPRKLIRLDSWQTVISGLGGKAESLREELLQRLTEGASSEMTLRNDSIWEWGVDGTVERQQLVVQFRRAIGYVQVYAYGQDCYLGWEAYVNLGSWNETPVGGGVDKMTGRLVEVLGVVSGFQKLGEYDINDANYIGEWINAIVSKVAKEKVALYKIDQEIDFRIIREERNQIADKADKINSPKNKVARFLRLG